MITTIQNRRFRWMSGVELGCRLAIAQAAAAFFGETEADNFWEQLA